MFIRVPYEPQRRKKWIAAIETHQEFDYVPVRFFLCENHFEPNCFIRFLLKTTLKPDSVPTKFPETSDKNIPYEEIEYLESR